jgi:alpha-D-ribose 1-methylphosphonate 5-triphosphate synthase subunit PhnG
MPLQYCGHNSVHMGAGGAHNAMHVSTVSFTGLHLAADALLVLLVALGQQLLQHASSTALRQALLQRVRLTQKLLGLPLVLSQLRRQRLQQQQQQQQSCTNRAH